jgi:putative ABC transport system permease protein
MLNNYLTIALRNLRKQPGFAATNVFGLSVGMACCLLVALYISRETHFDQHHTRASDLYRLGTTFVTLDGAEAGNEQPTFNSPAPMAAALQRDFPEIEKTTRVQRVFQHDKTLIQAIENGAVKNVFNEEFGYFVDSTYFDLFTYEFQEGVPSKALCEPNTVVISDEMAHKFFGNQSALGRRPRFSGHRSGGDSRRADAPQRAFFHVAVLGRAGRICQKQHQSGHQQHV